MVIPDKLVEFLHGPVFMALGTRDANLRPHHTSVVGGVVGGNREAFTLFLPEAVSRCPLDNLRDNGRVAFLVGSPSNECYQFKGVYLSHRPSNEREVAIQEIYRAKLVPHCVEHGMPEPLAKGLVLGLAYKPSLAVEFKVEEFFMQRPGPDAGMKIS